VITQYIAMLGEKYQSWSSSQCSFLRLLLLLLIYVQKKKSSGPYSRTS
jgi:hypothetical protein